MAAIMGILNVTPDSFSDGGQHATHDEAMNHALLMVEEGASIIDIGGESTRPGAEPVSAEEQHRRVVPVISGLAKKLPANIAISVDTRLVEVARAAIEVGARMVNDVSGGSDPEMLDLVASTSCTIVLMHMQNDPQTMQDTPQYQDVVDEVSTYLAERAQHARAAGIEQAKIVIDVGIGFGKTREHNLALMNALSSFKALGYPMLLGASRKRFMGAICRETDPKSLVGATCASTVWGAIAGVDIFRVHDVRANRQALELTQALLARQSEQP
ncbi:MAG: dihydropteroate synthase [Pseudomonadota bacterium]